MVHTGVGSAGARGGAGYEGHSWVSIRNPVRQVSWRRRRPNRAVCLCVLVLVNVYVCVLVECVFVVSVCSCVCVRCELPDDFTRAPIMADKN